MKLHKISIEGITAFHNSITIDFDNDLAGHDLFAITGPTGSGKSSILSAISLALYGKGHKKLSVENYVTLGKKLAKVELDFSIKLKRYRAIWKCKIATSAKSQKTRVETNRVLIDESGTALEVNAEEIIGLSQDQFFKTVIVNQGQFADFLTSSFSARKKTIEKIYGSEELGMLSPTLRKKISLKNHDIGLVEAKLSGINPYTPEEIKSFTNQRDKKNLELSNLKELTKIESPLLGEYKSLLDILHKISNHQTQVEETQLKLKYRNTKF